MSTPLRSHPTVWFGAVMLAGLGWGTLVLAGAGGRLPRPGAVGEPEDDHSHWGVRRRWVLVGLLLIAFFRNPWSSDDAWRYVWEAEVILEGRSPYAGAPDSIGNRDLRERMPTVYGGLNNRDVSAAYPPITQYACAAAVAIGKGLSGRTADEVGLASVRGLFGICTLLCLAPLARLRRARSKGAGSAEVWGWALCPLIVLELGASAHFDALGILLWLWAFVWLQPSERGRPWAEALGIFSLGAAILVKYLPIVSVPFLLRGKGWGWRSLALAAVLGLYSLPILFLEGSAHGITRGLFAYGLRWESAGLVHPWIEGALADWEGLRDMSLDPRRVSRAVIGFVFLGVAAHAWLKRMDPWRASGRLVGAFLILSPTLYPWYITWIVPFVILEARASWVVLIALAPLIHSMVPAWQLEGRWEEPRWLWPVLAIPFLSLRILESIRASKAQPEDPGHPLEPTS